MYVPLAKTGLPPLVLVITVRFELILFAQILCLEMELNTAGGLLVIIGSN